MPENMLWRNAPCTTNLSCVRAKVSLWETLFATKFFHLSHKDWNERTIHRAMHYSLPAELDAHVEAVSHVADFPAPMHGKPIATKSFDASKLVACTTDNGLTYQGYTTPATIRIFILCLIALVIILLVKQSSLF